MKERDPNLYRPQDHRIKSRKGVVRKPTKKEQGKKPPRPVRERAPEPPPPRKRLPIPWFLVGGILFSVMFISGILIGYELGTFYRIPDILMVGSVLVLLLSIYKAVDFGYKHWSDMPSRCKYSAMSLVVIIVVGLLIGSYLFVTKEPYHNWDYRVTLSCTSGCKVQIPVPMMDKDEAFFMHEELITEGQGNARVVDLRYEGKDIKALEVEWSGNMSIRVSGTKDYRHLALERHGLWNSSLERFAVVGVDIPDDGNVSLALQFMHEHITREKRTEEWSIEGQLGPGVTLLERHSV
jgi:hypothetical protein